MEVQPSDARGAEVHELRPNRGPFSSEAEALTELVARLVRGLDPNEVSLFGRRAERCNAPDTDFDPFVVTKTHPERHNELRSTSRS